MFCISCGAKLPDDARFCAVCGAKVYTPEPEERPEEGDDADAAEVTSDSGASGSEEAPEADDDAASDGQPAAESAPDAPESEVALREKTRMKVKNPALREGSGSLQLPEIDPSQPFKSTPAARDGREDDISVSPDVTVVLPPGPFKPSYGPLSASDFFEMDGTTAKMPRIETADGEVLVEGDSPVKNFVQSNTIPKRWTPLRVVALVAMVAVAAALAVAAVQLYGQRSQSAQSTSTLPAVTSTSASTSSQTVTQESTASSQTSEERTAEQRDSALFDAVSAAYHQAGELNDRLASVVDEYNTYYVASDQAARQQAADTCNALAADIAQAASNATTAMQNYACTEGTTYYDQFQNQLRLLDLLSQRVAPLVSSWERSVASADPASEESYILEPLTQVDSTTLVNEFDSLYGQAAPVEE